jgi:hypothetical protein
MLQIAAGLTKIGGGIGLIVIALPTGGTGLLYCRVPSLGDQVNAENPKDEIGGMFFLNEDRKTYRQDFGIFQNPSISIEELKESLTQADSSNKKIGRYATTAGIAFLISGITAIRSGAHDIATVFNTAKADDTLVL